MKARPKKPKLSGLPALDKPWKTVRPNQEEAIGLNKYLKPPKSKTQSTSKIGKKNSLPKSRFTSKALMKLAIDSPFVALSTCQCEFDTLETRYKAKLIGIIAAVYTVAYRMQSNWKDWVEFVHLGYWRASKHPPRRDKDVDKRLYLMMCYALRALDQNGRKRAWFYSTALQDLYDAGVKPEEIGAKIEEYGGVTALYRAAMEKRRIAREAKRREDEDRMEKTIADLASPGGDVTTSSEFDEDAPFGDDVHEEAFGGEIEYDNFGDLKEDTGNHNTGSDKPKSKRSIKLRMTAEQRTRLLSLKMGQSATVTMTRRADIDGRCVLKLTKAKLVTSTQSSDRSAPKSDRKRPSENARMKYKSWSDTNPILPRSKKTKSTRKRNS